MSASGPTPPQRPAPPPDAAPGSWSAPPQGPPTPWGQSTRSSTAPNAEKYLLEADALRRRQLRSALLHGSSRTWREHKRIWPAVIAGLIVVAVIVAIMMVVKAIGSQDAASMGSPQRGDSSHRLAPDMSESVQFA